MIKKIIKYIFFKFGYEFKKTTLNRLNSVDNQNENFVGFKKWAAKKIKSNTIRSNVIPKSMVIKSTLIDKNKTSIDALINGPPLWGFVKCNVKNHFFYMFLGGNDDGVALKFLHHGFYEKYTMSIWTEFTKLSSLIFDIGSHTGSFTLASKAANPSCNVISFEPHYLNFSRLALNLRVNSFSTENIYMLAASDQNLKQKFTVPKTYSYHSSGGKISNSSLDTDIYFVNSVTLDDFFEKSLHSKINLLKIDTEGHELNVLRGMENIINESKPTIFFECMKKTSDELSKLLYKYEYRIYIVNDKDNKLIPTNKLSPIYLKNKKIDMDQINRLAVCEKNIKHTEYLAGIIK